MTLEVLMLNDYPLGIYTTVEKANAAADEHEKTKMKHATSKLHYRTYPFVVDEKARF